MIQIADKPCSDLFVCYGFYSTLPNSMGFELEEPTLRAALGPFAAGEQLLWAQLDVTNGELVLCDKDRRELVFDLKLVACGEGRLRQSDG